MCRMTDRQLCEAVGTGDPVAPLAEAEFRRRHRPRVAVFARTVPVGLMPAAARPGPDHVIDLFLRERATAATVLDRPLASCC